MGLVLPEVTRDPDVLVAFEMTRDDPVWFDPSEMTRVVPDVLVRVRVRIGRAMLSAG